MAWFARRRVNSTRPVRGDAIYLVLTNAVAAAACALDLQKAMAAIDLASEGLPDQLALRLGRHLGPVFPTYDPVLKTSGFMGSHVSRTARIEPVTPPGAVYVTEAFRSRAQRTTRADLRLRRPHGGSQGLRTPADVPPPSRESRC